MAYARAGVDRARQAHYIGRMSEKNAPSLIDQELTRLEEQVALLLQTIERLMLENRSLRIQQESHSTERAALIEKNDLARNRVEAIVSRLKALESRA
jgi:cell division protein ZapB